jgi:uncharacterized membrane protein
MADGYLIWKLLHIVGAVMMLGNVVVTGAWAAVLWRHRKADTPRQIARGILWTDLVFTFGGGAMLVIAGIEMIRLHQLPWRELGWLRHGIELLALATLVWLVVLLPDQLRMEEHADTDQERFARHFRRWTIVGWIDTALLVAALALMVLRPVAG